MRRRLPLPRQARQVPDQQVQGAPGGQLRVEKPDRSGRGVARVGERRLAGLLAAPVHLPEGGDRVVHLTARLQERHRALEPQRDGRDGADVSRDLLAQDPVAAGHPAHERAVLVEQRHGHPVDLELGHERHLLAAEDAQQPRMPLAQLLDGGGVVQAEHRHGVPDRRQVPLDLGPDALRRRVGRDQVGVRRLDRGELLLQEVVLGIGDLGVAVGVVAFAVMPDLAAQLLGPARRGLGRARPRLPPGRLVHGSTRGPVTTLPSRRPAPPRPPPRRAGAAASG